MWFSFDFVLCCCLLDYRHASVDFGSRYGCPALFVKKYWFSSLFLFFNYFNDVGFESTKLEFLESSPTISEKTPLNLARCPTYPRQPPTASDSLRQPPTASDSQPRQPPTASDSLRQPPADFLKSRRASGRPPKILNRPLGTQNSIFFGK